mmetsp:Transcript_4082/g.14424  ORF Transcript_4082/g.14424 Transcript_4082/m.14424 type:complete len:218 (+) Transcript_4082:512-1165(+)
MRVGQCCLHNEGGVVGGLWLSQLILVSVCEVADALNDDVLHSVMRCRRIEAGAFHLAGDRRLKALAQPLEHVGVVHQLLATGNGAEYEGDIVVAPSGLHITEGVEERPANLYPYATFGDRAVGLVADGAVVDMLCGYDHRSKPLLALVHTEGHAHVDDGLRPHDLHHRVDRVGNGAHRISARFRPRESDVVSAQAPNVEGQASCAASCDLLGTMRRL